MTDFPHIPKINIESATQQLLKDYHNNTGKAVSATTPVFEIIEFLGYDLDFRSDGFYEDPNNLGGLHIDEKLVVINENLTEQEGRMHFTAAHEIGHIKLHVPILMEQRARENILCRLEKEHITLFPKVAARLKIENITPNTIRHGGKIIQLNKENTHV